MNSNENIIEAEYFQDKIKTGNFRKLIIRKESLVNSRKVKKKIEVLLLTFHTKIIHYSTKIRFFLRTVLTVCIFT